MAKLPTVTRLLTEDFPDQTKWIPKLLRPFNQLLESVTNALNKNLTIAENMDAEVKTLDVTTLPVAFRWTRPRKPVGLFVVACQNATGSAVALPAPTWEFTQTGEVSISALSGITPSLSAKYSITVVAITG